MDMIKVCAVAALLATLAVGCVAQKGDIYEDGDSGEREVPQSQFTVWQ